MIEQEDFSDGDIPSRRVSVLRALVGHRIVSATKYSYWPMEELVQEWVQEFHKNPTDIFSFMDGPLLVTFDTGLVLGMGSDSSTASVNVWIEANEAGQPLDDDPIATDPELYPIAATDPVYSNETMRRVLGARVVAISILVRKPQNVRYARLPNEVGVCFTLDSGLKVVAAHGLHDDSDDFVFISDRGILPEIVSDLKEYPIDGPPPVFVPRVPPKK